MKSELINKAEEFENRKFKFVTTSDRILAAREAKALILEINEVYKKNKRRYVNGHHETFNSCKTTH